MTTITLIYLTTGIIYALFCRPAGFSSLPDRAAMRLLDMIHAGIRKKLKAPLVIPTIVLIHTIMIATLAANLILWPAIVTEQLLTYRQNENQGTTD